MAKESLKIALIVVVFSLLAFLFIEPGSSSYYVNIAALFSGLILLSLIIAFLLKNRDLIILSSEK